MTVGQFIPYGVRPNGRFVDPTSVERGLACNCICLSCLLPLLAKQEGIRVHHFSHPGDHNCRNGHLVALLAAAKQVLQDARLIQIPAMQVSVTHRPPYGLPCEATRVLASACWQFESVTLDYHIGEAHADGYGIRTDGLAGVVDFRITSKTNAALRDAALAADIAAVEVNLLPLVGRSLTLAELAVEGCDCTDHRDWLHHPDAQLVEDVLLAQLVAAHPIQTPPSQWPAVPSSRFSGSGHELRTGTDLSFLDRERLAIRREHDCHRALTLEQKLAELEAAFGAPAQTWRELFATVQSNARPAIAAPAVLWQGALFQEFILGAKTRPHLRNPGFNTAVVNGWTWARFGLNTGSTMDVLLTEVEHFLAHLATLGYLQRWGGQHRVLKASLPPLNGPPSR